MKKNNNAFDFENLKKELLLFNETIKSFQDKEKALQKLNVFLKNSIKEIFSENINPNISDEEFLEYTQNIIKEWSEYKQNEIEHKLAYYLAFFIITEFLLFPKHDEVDILKLLSSVLQLKNKEKVIETNLIKNQDLITLFDLSVVEILDGKVKEVRSPLFTLFFIFQKFEIKIDYEKVEELRSSSLSTLSLDDFFIF